MDDFLDSFHFHCLFPRSTQRRARDFSLFYVQAVYCYIYNLKKELVRIVARAQTTSHTHKKTTNNRPRRLLQVDAPAHEPLHVPLKRVQSRPLIPTTPRIRRRILHRPRHNRSLRPTHHRTRYRRLCRHRRHHGRRAQRQREHRLGHRVSVAILPSPRPPFLRRAIRVIVRR